MSEDLPFVLPIAALVAAAAWDLRTRLIPDALSAAVAVSGLVWAASGGWAALGAAVLLAAATFAGGAVLFAAGQLGGGDVKLAAALVPWLTGAQVLDFLILTAIAGGGLCLAVALVRFVAVARADGAGPGLRAARAATAPYGVAIAVGGVAVLPWPAALSWPAALGGLS